MEKLQRKIRGYKIPDRDYNRAIKRAKKDKVPLATQIEKWVTKYGKDGKPLDDMQTFIR